MACGSDCFLMRATAVDYSISNVVDLYDSGTGRWSTAQLSQAREFLSATCVGAVALFAGGNSSPKGGSMLRSVLFLLCEGLLIAVVRCAMGTWVFVCRDGVRYRLLSYVRHCRWCSFQCCGLVRQRNRTMVDGSAQSGARLSFSDICWKGGHVCRGFRR
jgi:hypothetical protein